jgi:hypothetical protein
MSIQQAAAAGKEHDSSTGNLTSLVRIPQKRSAEGFVLTDIVVSIKLNSKSYFGFFSDRNIFFVSKFTSCWVHLQMEQRERQIDHIRIL